MAEVPDNVLSLIASQASGKPLPPPKPPRPAITFPQHELGPGETERPTEIPRSPENLAFTAGVRDVRGIVALPGVPGMAQSLDELVGRPIEGATKFPRGVVGAKRELSDDDLGEVRRAVSQPVAQTTSERQAASPDPTATPGLEALSETPLAPMSETVDATLHGIRQGLQEIVTGPIQAGLEQVAPETARTFTQKLNEMEDRFESPKNHPTAAFAGKMVGTTIGILGGAGMLKTGLAAAQVAPRLLERMGLFSRSATVGAVTGTTSYNAQPDETSRAVEGVVGATVGVLGAAVAKGVQWGVKAIADTQTYRSFLGLMKDSVGSLTPSTTKLKDYFLAHYDNVWQQKTEKYELRNAAGQTVAPGFPREEIGALALDAIQGTRKAGVAPTPTTRAVATGVDRELGGPEARAQEAAHGQRVKDFEREHGEWQQTYASGIPENMKAQQLQRDIDSGRIPAAPVHPGEFEHEPVTPEQLLSAVQVINRGWSHTKDAATRTQLTQMRQGLLSAAEKAAQEVGLDASEFMRRAAQAGRFNRENIVPLQKAFGATPAEVRGSPAVPGSGVTPAKFFDRAVKMIEGHDMDALRAFKRMMGDRAQPEIVRIAAFRMLTAAQEKGGKGLAEYVGAHREALQELVGKRGIDDLRGMANIAERVGKEPEKHGWLWKTIHHPWLGSLMMYEGVLHGSPGRVAIGAGVLVGPHVVHGLAVGMGRLYEMPPVQRLIRSAVTVKPDSPAMTTLLKRIEREAVKYSAVAARTTAPEAPNSPF